MNLKKLYEILNETTVQLRKGEIIKESEPIGHVRVIHIDAMPHEKEIDNDVVEKIDMEFLIIGVNKSAAEKNRAELISLLDDYPEPDRLAAGPSYIEVGAVVGDQGAAFQLFALGKVLGLWGVVTPSRLGLKGQDAIDAAGRGYIMITGYRKEGKTS